MLDFMQDLPESVRSVQSQLLVLRLQVYAVAYHWRFPTVEDRVEKSPPFSLYTNYEQEESHVYRGDLDRLSTISPLHDVNALSLLNSIARFIRYQLSDTDWEHFPFNFNKTTSYPTSPIHRHQHFYRSCFTGQTNYSIAIQILTMPENLIDLERECKFTAFQFIYYLSESNWTILLRQFGNCLSDWQFYQEKINSNSELNVDSPASSFDLGRFISIQHAKLNKQRLQSVMDEILNYLVGLQEISKCVVSVVLRNILHGWIQDYPEEYQELHEAGCNLFENQEPLYEWLGDNIEGSTKKKAIHWPTLTMLFIVSCSDATAFVKKSVSILSKRSKSPIPVLFDGIKKSLKSKSFEIGVYCCGELLHAATAVKLANDGYLRAIFFTFEQEIKDKLFDLTKPLNVVKDDEGYVTETFIIEYCCNNTKLLNQNTETAFLHLLEPNVPLVFKKYVVASILLLLRVSGSPPKFTLTTNICRELRNLFFNCLKKEIHSEKATTPSSLQPLKNIRKSMVHYLEKENKRVGYDDSDRLIILYHILLIWNVNPLFSIQSVVTKEVDLEEIKFLFKETFVVLNEPFGLLRDAALQFFSKFLDPSFVSAWDGSGLNQSPTEQSVVIFWKVSSLLLRQCTRQILSVSISEGGLKLSCKDVASLCANLLFSRNQYIKKHLDIVKKGASLPERFATNVTLEVALNLLLNSPDMELSRIAVNCISQAIYEVDLVDIVDNEKIISPFFENIFVYKEIELQFNSEYWNQTISPKAHSKSVRSIMRMFEVPTPGLMGAWEEIYRRWKTHHNNFVDAGGLSSSGSSLASLTDLDEENVTMKRIGLLSQTKGMKIVIDAQPAQSKTKEFSFQEFFNYTGTLFALSNMCILAKDLASGKGSNLIHTKSASILVETPSPSILDHSKDLTWVSSMADQLKSSYSHAQSVVERFIGELTDLLVSENVSARESIKELLGYEIGGKLAGL
jgi:hypothetical protein